ncbi:hypothetical protein [Gloeocapsopsis dulcis]|uniref:Nitrate reductase n=1 Tax=Gloeocapsopsis dulcis AAB1 = 1H9 TaxID=1433147 RepID=A0A6N8FUY5_9CHRO|nr:hypothetical protein [Gloeocapsopsis dulcis]MUL36928.1 hypothetical protein [Gloeocapsopsis dulcis AAB1 = 1H9]WNN88741.1 hypothetical protein P0S91_21100 [Gloeocapsopsis dulcis]
MNLFSQEKPKADPTKVRQLKTWIYELLSLEPEIAVSISQLQCKEPGCPPVETAITILTDPAQQYKIHKAIGDIGQADLLKLFQTE